MFLDTSIVVKLLVTEADSDFYQAALADQRLSASELALTETWSTLLFKERQKEITVAQRLSAWRVFNERVRSREIVLHPLNGTVLRKAHHILERCHPAVPLRTLDAIHTAACDLTQDFPLCTADKRMRAAAGVLGIPVFPIKEPS